MRIHTDDPVRIIFEPGEANAARRLLWRLIREFGFAPVDRQGGLEAVIDRTSYRLRFDDAAPGGPVLSATNAAGGGLLPAIAQGLRLTWVDPTHAPTHRRRAVQPEVAELINRLLATGDSP